MSLGRRGRILIVAGLVACLLVCCLAVTPWFSWRGKWVATQLKEDGVFPEETTLETLTAVLAFRDNTYVFAMHSEIPLKPEELSSHWMEMGDATNIGAASEARAVKLLIRTATGRDLDLDRSFVLECYVDGAEATYFVYWVRSPHGQWVVVSFI